MSDKKEWARDLGQSSLKRDKKQTVSSNKYLGCNKIIIK